MNLFVHGLIFAKRFTILVLFVVQFFSWSFCAKGQNL